MISVRSRSTTSSPVESAAERCPLREDTLALELRDLPETVRPTSLPLTDWTCCGVAPDEFRTWSECAASHARWLPVTVPGTVAQALRNAGQKPEDGSQDLDAQDWWFQTEFVAPEDSRQATLVLEGLATLAEVWLNGERLLSTDNMFRRYCVPLGDRLREQNRLAIRFRSLTHDLQKKRTRPKWKTALVAQQQLRWIRTTLLGRIPGWSPPVAPVGPWQPVRIESGPVRLDSMHLTAQVKAQVGCLDLRAQLTVTEQIESARLIVRRHGDLHLTELDQIALTIDGTARPYESQPAAATSVVRALQLTGSVEIVEPDLWWPHTHGTPALYQAELQVRQAGRWITLAEQSIGFRTVAIDDPAGAFGIRINREPVFCRGACWTVSDIASLTGSPDQLRRDLLLARDAGANLIRVGGTMLYESDRFYRLCDELGLLVWQDFPFANMDYPVDDPVFLENIRQEVGEQLQRISAHPSAVVCCGNSEIEQQAAMLGMPRELWSNHWFREQLPELCRQYHPASVYVRSTPCDGVLPFQPEQGLSHFYGIGAYRRSLSELRQAGVKFTSECLGFSNIPEPSTISAIADTASLPAHDPRWKRRVPRDTGAAWDFEEIRDHYVRELFGVDPVALRAQAPERWLQYGRVATGEMMSRTFAEWRSPASSCRGALVWFFKDLWPGAGWGVVDACGIPKAAYYALRRVWQPRQITITNEGLNGLHLHLVNESRQPLSGQVQIQLFKQPSRLVREASRAITLSPRERRTLSADDLLGQFCDVNYAYRFGPPQHDLVVACLRDEQGHVISEMTWSRDGQEPQLWPVELSGLAGTLSSLDANVWQLQLQAAICLQSVRISARGFIPDDNYFPLYPGREKTVLLRPAVSAHGVAAHGAASSGAVAKTCRIDVEALNLDGVISISPQPTTAGG